MTHKVFNVAKVDVTPAIPDLVKIWDYKPQPADLSGMIDLMFMVASFVPFGESIHSFVIEVD